MRTLSHSDCSSNGGIDDILVREVDRSVRSCSLVDDAAWAVVGDEVMSSVADEDVAIIFERNDLREDDDDDEDSEEE